MATSSTTKLLIATMDALKVQFPSLFAFGTDFKEEPVALNQQVNARIRKRPTVQTYDGTTGYFANEANAKALTEDVPVTLDQHKHVPVGIDFLEAFETEKHDLYQDAIADMVYELGKEALDYQMSLLTPTNFSESSTFALADADKDMLGKICGDLNGVGVPGGSRYGIVNTEVANILSADSRIASADYHGQLNGENAYKRFRGIDGFTEIFEYPDLPANGDGMGGFFGHANSVVMVNALPTKIADMVGNDLINRQARITTITDPVSGLSMAMIEQTKAGPLDTSHTIAWAYGMSAGSQGALPAAITSGTPTATEWYKITSVAGGADFTAAGAFRNEVGHSFKANGTAPTWGTGSLQLISQKTNQYGHRLLIS